MAEKPLTDIELEHLAIMGDSDAFGRLIRKHDPDLRGVAWNVVRSQTAVDDVMQRSYEKAFKAVGNFDHRSSMKTWLHSITHRTAIDYIRSESIRTHDEFDTSKEPSGTEEFGSSGIEVSVARSVVREMLAGVDPDTRAMLYYTVGLGYSFDETAAILGVERGTVASRVSRAKAKLRSMHEDEGGRN